MIVHFDVDQEIEKYFKDKKYDFSLSKITISKIKDKDRIKVISIKSQSSIDGLILKYFPNLKLIITRTVGMNHIDLDICRKNNIKVVNIPDYGASNIAEHALALLLAGCRQIVQADKQVHQGKFCYKNFLGTALKEKTLGVIGTGRIGLELIKLIQSFDLKVICYDVVKNEQAKKKLGFSYVSLEFLLKNSDFISIHVPLLNSTLHLIGEREINLMEKGVILVNTSRGEIIDTKALIKHIKKFKAVCLDVVEGEKNFDKNNPLLKYKNIIITPHIGFYTYDSIKTIADKTEEIINDYLQKRQ